MKKRLKILGFSSCVLLFLILLLIPLTLSQKVVEVTPSEEEKTNFLLEPLKIFVSPIFWGFMLFVALFVIVCVILFFVVKAVLKYFKSKNDLYYRVLRERLKLSRIQRRYSSSKYFRYKKNVPLRLVKFIDRKLVISEPIAYYRGDYVTHEGNIIISLIFKNKKKFFLFPIVDILIIPNRDFLIIDKKSDKTKGNIEVKIENIPNGNKFIQFNDNEILIFAESLSNTGIFYIPVLRDMNGHIVDLSLPVFETMKRVVLSDYLYDQSSEFVALSRKSMDMNPNLRYQIKSSDTSQSVEVPDTANKGV